MDRYNAVESDTLWVIRSYGSNAEERKNPGSKAKSQAARIAEFARQLDLAETLLAKHQLDLIRIVSSANLVELNYRMEK